MVISISPSSASAMIEPHDRHPFIKISPSFNNRHFNPLTSTVPCLINRLIIFQHHSHSRIFIMNPHLSSDVLQAFPQTLSSPQPSDTYTPTSTPQTGNALTSQLSNDDIHPLGRCESPRPHARSRAPSKRKRHSTIQLDTLLNKRPPSKHLNKQQKKRGPNEKPTNMPILLQMKKTLNGWRTRKTPTCGVTSPSKIPTGKRSFRIWLDTFSVSVVLIKTYT
jgi:hypothetical protein